jgi:predicted metalloprotease with PDZ domain
MEELRFEIQFRKPENFFGLTSLKTTSKSTNIQSFVAEDFDELFDSPILFSEPDMSTFKVANTEFTIGVYNELGSPLSERMAEIIKSKMEAVQKFVGGFLPVENYVFLFYIKDFSRLENFLIECPDFEWGNTKKALKISREYRYSFGALEHHNSSLFCTSAISTDQTSFELMDFVIHEFFHIYTPINLHSKLIHNFDYVNPQLSAHRWLYEGITEYFSGLIKLKSGLYDLNFFLQEFIRPKIQMANRFEKPVSFTEFSKNANKEPYKDLYPLSYSKGPLLAMFLDFEIMRLTSCQKTLRDVFFKIYEENKNIPLEEEEIIPLLVNEVHPDLQQFFDRYIVGIDSLDLESGFRSVGIQYQKEVQQKVPSLRLSYVPLFQYFCFKKITYPQELKSGDKVHIKNWGRRGLKPFLKPDG